MPERTYTDAEVREILRRAVERSAGGAGSAGLSRSELVDAAKDVGIASEAVDAAILELEGEGALSEEIATLRRERRHDLASSVSTWAIVNAGLFGVDWMSGGGWWVFWPLGAWGVVLALRLKGEFFAKPAEERKQAQRRLEDKRRERERKLTEERRRQEQERRAREGGLEGVVERGVQDLLKAAARRIEGKVRFEAGQQQGERQGQGEREREGQSEGEGEGERESVRKRRG